MLFITVYKYEFNYNSELKNGLLKKLKLSFKKKTQEVRILNKHKIT